ncbi:MAG: hypothetical protein U0638_16425 [Phycisphaerales bacterium]
MPASSRSGLSTLVAAAAGTALVLAGVGAYVSNNIWSASRALHAAPAPAAKANDADANRQLRNVLVRAGLGADALTAAGVDGAKAAEVVAAVRGVLAEQGASLKLADENHRAATVLRQQIIAKIQAGTSTEQDRSALASTDATLAHEAQARAAVLDACLAAANAVLSPGEVQALAAIRSLPADLPLKYRAASMNSGQADALRSALGEARAANAVGEETSNDASSLLHHYDADTAVSTANANLINNRTAVTAAWEQAVGR